MFFVAFILIVILLLLLSAVWPPDSPWSPWWKTYKKAGRAIIRLGNISSKDKVYELGSGDGEFLLLVAKEVGCECVGVEIDPLRDTIARVRSRFSGLDKKITFKKKNFFDEDLRSADVVYVYLIPRVLKKLIPKLKKELKKNTRIISYRYKMDLPLVKEDTANKLFLYKLP
ncbi:MAG: SAM-dependent methyltransferase [Candidatus Levyibacteriota bacterium]